MAPALPSDPLRVYVEAAQEGDDAALGHVVRATQPAIWRLCASLGSSDSVEDLVQETYLRAVKAIPTFRGETPVQVWLLSIARRVCADDVRRRRRVRRLVDRLVVHTASDADVTADSERHQLDRQHVEALLTDLDHDRREAFVLTQVVGLSYQEASDVIGCPVGTVRSRVARARADLVESLRRATA
jgi:RNA polymerase sigma-70 factor (ECF subfamily)